MTTTISDANTHRPQLSAPANTKTPLTGSNQSTNDDNGTPKNAKRAATTYNGLTSDCEKGLVTYNAQTSTCEKGDNQSQSPDQLLREKGGSPTAR